MLNPERYTGYKGPSAHRIWRNIYMENCFRYIFNFNKYTFIKFYLYVYLFNFRPDNSPHIFIQTSKINGKLFLYNVIVMMSVG